MEQLEQLLALTAEYAPIPQLTQTDESAEPTVEENVPAAQDVQAEAPMFVWYVPVAQVVQLLEPEIEELPAAQETQPVDLEEAE